MKNDLHITTSFNEPELMTNLVEKLAIRHNDRYIKTKVPKPWKSIETSTVEAYVNGVVEFDFDENSRIRMPFTTCFMFSCAREKKDEYKLHWGVSFS